MRARTSLAAIPFVLGAAVLLRQFLGWPAAAPTVGGAAGAAARSVSAVELPLAYSIGSVDSRFGIDAARVLALAERARLVWEAPAGRRLLRYEIGAPLRVDLEYDWRQEKLLAALGAKVALDGNSQSHQQALADHREQARLFEAERLAFEADTARLGERLSDYNGRVARWNESPSRTEADRRALDGERRQLDDDRNALARRGTELNRRGAELDRLAESLNALARIHNEGVETFNDTMGRTGEFEKGLFDGSRIVIYEFEDEDDLTIALAHEFGHALGLAHVDDPTAIMHPRLARQDRNDIRLSPADLALLDRLIR